MRAGMLRESITIERRNSSGLDAYGNPTTGLWETLAVRRADIRETPGREIVQAGALIEVSPATIRVRSDAQTQLVRAGDRIHARGAVWNIEATTEIDQKQRVIEFRAVKGVSE